MDMDYESMGFNNDTLIHYFSGIDEDILESRPVGYWLRRFVSENEPPVIENSHETRNTFAAEFKNVYGMLEAKAEELADSVDEDYLICRPPSYWVRRWILQQELP